MTTNSNAAADELLHDDSNQYLTFIETRETTELSADIVGTGVWGVMFSPDSSLLALGTSRGDVIVVKVESPSQDRIVGMVVDGVSEVYSVASNDIQPAPEFGGDVDTKFIKGLSTVDERMLILLDINELLNESIATDGELVEPATSASD